MSEWREENFFEFANCIKTGCEGYGGVKKYYSTGSIKSDSIEAEGEYSYSEKPSRANRVAVVGDVLQARMKSTNKALLIDNILHNSLFSTGFIQSRPELNKCLPEYIYHFFKSECFLRQRDIYATGSTQEALTDIGLKKIVIPVPQTIEEQQQIVELLEERINKLNNARKKIDKIPLILKRFRQSVLANAFSGKLTAQWREGRLLDSAENLIITNNKKKQFIEVSIDYQSIIEKSIPNEWIWTALANYATCARGRFSVRPRNDPSCYNGCYPFIQIGDLPRDGGYIAGHIQTLNEKGFSVSKMFPKDTVAIAIVGATIANTGILPYPMCFPDSLVGIETGTLIGNKYVEYYIRFSKDHLRQVSYAGGGQPNIKLDTLEPYPLPLPPFSEQEEVVRRVDKLFTIADSIEERYNLIKTKLDKAEKAIYAKVFRVEL